MSVAIENFSAADKHLPMRDLVAALQDTLRRNHLKILEAARADWQSRSGAADRSDACATIRVATAGGQVKRGSSKRRRAVRWGC